jgi:hypothetical protein
MPNKYVDVIGLMSSGFIYSYNVFKSEQRKNSNTRFLVFYPVLITKRFYLERLETRNDDFNRANDKLKYFKSKAHLHIDEFAKKSDAITEEEVIDLQNRNSYYREHDFEYARRSLQCSIWQHILCKAFDKTDSYDIDISELDFINSPEIRLSGTADPSRTALLVDDFLHHGDTALYSIWDMFRLGYTDVRFHAKSAPYKHGNFGGNYEKFLEEYSDNNVRRVDWGIVKL